MILFIIYNQSTYLLLVPIQFPVYLNVIYWRLANIVDRGRIFYSFCQSRMSRLVRFLPQLKKKVYFEDFLYVNGIDCSELGRNRNKMYYIIIWHSFGYIQYGYTKRIWWDLNGLYFYIRSRRAEDDSFSTDGNTILYTVYIVYILYTYTYTYLCFS